MEVVVNPASGRLIVLLNGTAHMGCQSDFTCPGISHCRSQDEFSWIDGMWFDTIILELRRDN